MPVYLSVEDLPEFKNAVLTIGSFDGVHQGHASILKLLLETAKEIKGTPIVISFEPHPRFVIETNSTLQLLNTTKEKIELLQKQGIEHIVLAPFTLAFSQLRAADFIQYFLVEKFKPHTIVIGYDHKFGKHREGNIQLLQQYASHYNYSVKEIPIIIIDDISISSTKIRNALTQGNIKLTKHFLGYPYSFTGIVVHGAKRGKSLGYATANIKLTDTHKLVPTQGIFVIMANCDTEKIMGMMSIGTNPTFESDKHKTIEVHLFNFDKNIYDKKIEIFFLEKLRDEVKFNSQQELVEQLHVDKQTALEYLYQNNYYI